MDLNANRDSLAGTQSTAHRTCASESHAADKIAFEKSFALISNFVDKEICVSPFHSSRDMKYVALHDLDSSSD